MSDNNEQPKVDVDRDAISVAEISVTGGVAENDGGDLQPLVVFRFTLNAETGERLPDIVFSTTPVGLIDLQSLLARCVEETLRNYMQRAQDRKSVVAVNN